MNRQRYKLVFNRHRGQLMAVAEIASSLQHHGRTSANAAAMPDLLPSALRFSLLAIALAMAMNTVAHAQILGDRNAPRNQQPTVLVTPNGVPVVNIQTPSTAGVSVNSYRQFDVGPNGAILNNAQGTTSTQLGGYVAGNPWLATGAARVIVNQVNSANPSYLRGYLEVAGARAQVVVANPAGITCSGCGFINANRATLTTGVPQMVNGNLESYRVASGAVRIEGNGLDASRTDYAEIIARAVQVNAGVWAPELKVSAGLNTVSADHASVVPGVAAADAAPAVAIDVAQLGGMYAGHIYLTSTEHGVGVRNAGSIGASVGQAVVTADGRLENSGSITANGLLAVQATGGISNAGELGSKSAASLNTTALDNSGSVASAGTLAVQASAAVQNTGSIGGEGIRDAALPQYQALNAAIAAFNDNLHSRMVKEWTIYDGTEQITRTVVTKSDPGMITSGGNMRLAAGTVNNYASQFIAGGTVAGDSVNGTNLNNTGPLGRQRVVSTGSASYTYVKSHTFSADDRRYDDAPYQSQDIVTNFQLDITPTSGAGPNRQSSVRAVASSVSGASGASAGAASIRIANLDLTLPNNALFRINAGPAQRFLVQTDPQFVGTRSWLSSDFMLNQLGLTASVRQLGDGFYEQQLIQRQIQQITGQRYLAGYSSNEAQYQALMNAGVQVAQSQRYTLGVALTDAQIAELKTDIVWLVKQTVTLADGSTQEVLVPQVYIHASNVQVTGQGTLIAGNDVAFQAAQDIVNSAATTVATANAVTSGTNINQNASMSVSEANGSLTAVAGRDINLKASGTSADNVTLVAQRDVNLSTVHETSQEKITWDSSNRAEVNRDNAIGSTIQGKEISVTAGRDINAQAAYVNAEGSLAATAGNNVNIGTDVSTASARDQHKKTDSGGMLASQTVSTDDSSSEAVNQGTTFSGNTVAVRAGNDINVKGSNVVSTSGTGMAAGNDVNIVAAVDSSTKNNFRQETTSGVMGSGFGVTIGTREQSHDVKAQGQTASASMVGSTDGNVSIVAGNRYTQVGSDVAAPKGDIDIAAKSVEIRAAEQVSKTTTEDKYKQSGLTVAVTSPAISAIQTMDQMADAAGKTKNGRVQALAAATAGMSAYSAVGEMQKGTADGSANIGISATLGSSQNSSRTEQNTVTQRGSSVASGGNMSIRATGDGANSNITIAGSDINAKRLLNIFAANLRCRLQLLLMRMLREKR